MSHDSALQQMVLAELSWEPGLVAGHIGVVAEAGVVTLTGHVETYAAKAAAAAAALRVRGVSAVAEEIEVRLPTESVRDDADIAAAAVNRLDWDAAIPTGAIEVKVEGGWVTLTGAVDWRYQKIAAAREVGALWGVSGLSDLVTVKARVDVGHLEREIAEALSRSWFDTGSVSVTADGGRIRLTGSVPSARDRDQAVRTAWSAPGATEIQNDIVIA